MNPAAVYVFSFGCGRGSFEGLAVRGRSAANAVFSVLPGEGFPDLAAIFGMFSGRSRRKSGNRHFPSEFCGQTTLGLTSDTSLITSRREKREKNAIRRPKFFASRKLPPVPAVPCAMVMPLSFKPLHGVTLMRPIFKVAPKRWRSSCWILACVPCDCTYRLRARKRTAPRINNPPMKINARRPNFCTRRRYADHV